MTVKAKDRPGEEREENVTISCMTNQISDRYHISHTQPW